MLDLPSIPYDLQRATVQRGRAVECLRSATFVSDGLTSAERRDYLGECTRWIGEYHQWFSATVGVSQGRGLHLYYDRDVTLTGEALLDCSAEIMALGSAVRELGFSFSLSLPAETLGNDFPRVLELTNPKVVTAVAVLLEPAADGAAPACLAQCVERLIQHGVNVGLIGDMRQFSERGLLASQIISAADLTWYPSTPPGRQARPVIPVHPCHARMRLFVDGIGNMYPCFGLIGKAEGMLGNIREPIARTGLAETPVLELLDRWEREGPDQQEAGEAPEDEGSEEDRALPQICRWHRRNLV